MSNCLHLHIGYHKTGTTSLQKHLSSKRLPFNYIGRRYNNSAMDRLIESLGRAVMFNAEPDIARLTKELHLSIDESGHTRHLISYEGFLRPNQTSFKGLSTFVRLLEEYLDVKVFVSMRDVRDLIFSRFVHDLTRRRDFSEIIKNQETLKNVLEFALVDEFECSYPFCNEPDISCACGEIKKIPLRFYDIDYIRQKLLMPIYLIDLLNNDVNDFTFYNSDIYPLPQLNQSAVNVSTETKTYLLKIISDRISS